MRRVLLRFMLRHAASRHAGDRVSGKISREEVAALALAAAALPAAANKTVEVRRSEALDGKGKAMGDGDVLRLFLGVAEDRLRAAVGIEPFPAPALPPAPVTAERKKVGGGMPGG